MILRYHRARHDRERGRLFLLEERTTKFCTSFEARRVGACPRRREAGKRYEEGDRDKIKRLTGGKREISGDS